MPNATPKAKPLADLTTGRCRWTTTARWPTALWP